MRDNLPPFLTNFTQNFNFYFIKIQIMPKKFQGENTKAVAARQRKAELKATEKEKIEREKEDQFWEDDDKQAQRKIQRKVWT